MTGSTAISQHAGARVLVVDDDPVLRSVAIKSLEHSGFVVTGADSGATALQNLQQARFDLMLLDVLMPDLDGFEVCRRARALPHGQRLPILMLTGLNDTASVEKAYEVGATDFITKPINGTLLVHRARYVLRASATADQVLRSRNRLERAQHIANMGAWEMALPERQVSCSPELMRVFAAANMTLDCSSPEALLRQVHDDDRAAVAEARDAAARDGKAYQITYRVQQPNGGQRTLFEQAEAVRDDAEQLVAVEGVTQDITERVEAEKRMQQLAHFDSVTGLPNRQFFIELASAALDRSQRLGARCALLHIDMDRFKSVNDALGYSEADAVLRVMGERIQTLIRTSDLAAVNRNGGESVVARIGGNAFTLLLLDVHTEKQAALVSNRLLRAISAPLLVHQDEMMLTASIGIALYPRDSSDVRILSRCAEQAVYSAKAAGRAQHRFFDETMNAQARLRLSRETDLRHAISHNLLDVHYQPMVNAAQGQMVGVEALARWPHPEQGMISPGEFIPLAEDSGLILPLTDWILERVCADLARRQANGLPPLPVAVNLSSASFAREGLPRQLDQLLGKYRLPPGLLTLEVTESLLMADVEHAIGRLAELRQRGIRVALDDFGTGYSSLTYLKRFPVDELKIDREFVREVWRGGRDSAIAASVIALGREFGLRVLAEGVETAQQANTLVAQGCPHQQGYLFARPMACAQFDDLLRQGTALDTSRLAQGD